MKPLRFTTNAPSAAYMKQRRDQNRAASARNSNENWFADILRTKTEHKWTRQVMWGYRIFDFWCAALGVAIEVDGPEHDSNYDAYRDEYNFRRSGIVVLRVRNRNQADADAALLVLTKVGAWKDRRELLGLNVRGKKARRHLASQEYNGPSMLQDFLAGLA